MAIDTARLTRIETDIAKVLAARIPKPKMAPAVAARLITIGLHAADAAPEEHREQAGRAAMKAAIDQLVKRKADAPEAQLAVLAKCLPRAS